MRKLVVDKKTGFHVKDPERPIIIRDDRGVLFYTTEPMLPRVTQFNLPSGLYWVEKGSFQRMANPVPFVMIKLPPPTRIFYPSGVSRFEIKFEPNPNKCTVDWDERQIILDRSFLERPLPDVDFIISHEVGHKYYGLKPNENDDDKYNYMELCCDMFAANRMIKMGYNPSQIGFAQLSTLSDNAQMRKESLTNRLINAYERTKQLYS